MSSRKGKGNRGSRPSESGLSRLGLANDTTDLSVGFDSDDADGSSNFLVNVDNSVGRNGQSRTDGNSGSFLRQHRASVPFMRTLGSLAEQT